ncbi:hypothetical protein CKO09_03215 [Chromatium weissei]|nr:hypothetical protein [Chromatium weissei]
MSATPISIEAISYYRAITNTDPYDPYGLSSYFDIKINDSNGEFSALGWIDGWCLNADINITGNHTVYQANLYSSQDPDLPTGLVYVATNLDLVNWILNQDFTANPNYSYGEVQSAIWNLMGSPIYTTGADIEGQGTVSATDVNTILSLAAANGEGFVPNASQYSTYIIDPYLGTTHYQPLIVVTRPASIGNYVWLDNNKDGIQNDGESGVDGVTVNLYDGAGNFISTTTTGDDYSTAVVEQGYYQFTGLKAGSYQVKFIANDYVFTVQDANENNSDAIDSDVDKDGLSQVVTLIAGESNQTIDAGLIGKSQQNSTPATLSGYVYHDEGNDGLWDGTTAGIKNITITLLDANGNPILDVDNNPITATTNANGFYEFIDLEPGTYGVSESQPNDYLDGKDTAGEFGGGIAGNDVITGTTLEAGQNSTNNNFGEIKPATVSGFVYVDINNDGNKDSGELSISGVTIALTGTNDLGAAVNLTTTTATDGSYSFTNLRPGTYTVNEAQPIDYLDGQDTAGAPGGGTAGNDVINTIVLKSGDSSTNNNFGELPKPARLSGYVYEDAGDDGIKSASETAIAGVTVKLLNAAGNEVATTLTNDSGYYEFTNLAAGTYHVVETQPNDYLDGKDTAGNSAVLNGNDRIDVTLVAGDNSQNNNFGELPKPARLSGYVYEDAGDDGIKSASETAIAGVTVKLLNAAGDEVATTLTNDSGYYEFINLAAGTYHVVETQPNDYLDGKDTAGNSAIVNSDDRIEVTLVAGDNSQNNNFGELPKPARLSGYVYEDAGDDGIKSASETAIAGVTVKLLNAAGDEVATTLTNDSGYYEFTNLAAGTYHVVETQPTDYLDGKDTAGNGAVLNGNDRIDVTLVAGDNSQNNNFGELPKPARLSGYVYEDAGDDGIKSASETAIAGVTVKLLNAAGDEVATTLTNDSGYYEFTNLAAGTYHVVETQPNDYLDGKDTAGNSAVLNGNDRIDVTLVAGDNSQNNNFGELPKPIANVGVDIEKYVRGSTIETNTSCGDSEGFSPGFWKTHAYSTDLNDWEPTGYKAGDSVEAIFGIELRGTPTLLDALSAGGGGVNALLRQSVAGLLNASNANVDYKYSAAEVIQMTKAAVTSCNYTATKNLLEIENSKEGDLSSSTSTTGTTTVETANADADTAPGISLAIGDTAIYTYEVKNIGDVALEDVTVTDDKIATLTFVSGDANGDNRLDVTETWVYTASEAVTATGLRTNIGTVVAEAAGKTVTDADAANYTVAAPPPPPVVNNASLGDRVWVDKDGDGVQDSGEVGIAGVKVTLIGGGADGKISTTADNITKTATTNATGNYSFTDLAAGEYQVAFDTSTVGSGYVLTKQNSGSDDAADSDANTSTGKSQIVTLAAGEANKTIDAGVYQKASVGDKVWDDMSHNNIQDATEPGIANIKVKLTGAGVDGSFGTADDIILNTTTNSSGNYLFSNLDPGAYTLTFDKTNVQHYNYGAWYNMSNWKWAVKDAGTNDALDSDVTGNAIATTNVTVTSVFTLTSGQNDMTKDAGITPIVIDLNGDGIHTIARTDSDATFDLLGNGTPITSGWLSANDGFLAIDSNHNGTIDGVSELFGGLKQGDGFAKLSSFDSDGNGLVDEADENFASLSIWQDSNGNHLTDDGELLSLVAVGVTRLNTEFTELPFLDAQGNLLLERSSATFSDGHTVEMTDVYFNVSTADAAAAGIEVTGIANLMHDCLS